MPDPIYTPLTCRNVAYQLNWSYSLFWKDRPPSIDWWSDLQRVCEPDGIRLLHHEMTAAAVSLFLVSTTPDVVPQVIAQRIKGRLQNILRPHMSDPFQRNYALRSIGSSDRETVEKYIEGQLMHHRLVDPRTEELFSRYQFQDQSVDLSEASQTSHAIYWYNLHVVLVNAGRHPSGDEERLKSLLSMSQRAARNKGHRLSRFGQLPDHIHLSLRARLNESPEEIALGYLNNFSYSLGMRPEFRHSYYVGTIGEYTTRAIPRSSAEP